MEIHQRNGLVGIIVVQEDFFAGHKDGIPPTGMLFRDGLIAFDHDGHIRVVLVAAALYPWNQILKMHRSGRRTHRVEVGAENPHIARIFQVLERLLADVVVGLDPAGRANFGDIDRLVRREIRN